MVNRYCNALFPWEVWNYPGKKRLTLASIGNRTTYRSLLRWGDETRKLPRWAAVAMLGHLQTKIAQLEAVASELRAWIASAESDDNRHLNGANLRGRRIPRERDPTPGS